MKHLSQEQRYIVQGMLCSHCSQKQIADEIGCSQSAISRELKRNRSRGEYKARTAQKKATQRAKRIHVHTKYEKYDWRYVDASIRCYLSPQQVRGRCKLMNLRCPCVELIYQHIWDDKKHGGDLYSYLRRKNKKYASRGRKNDYRGRIPGLVPIDQRPAVVEKKARFGDLEVDLVIGKDHKGKLLTINDRASNKSWLKRLNSKNSDEVAAAIVEALLPYKGLLKTITSDNGREFADHAIVAKKLGIKYYFAHPYHSWERGANENMNGLIRQFLPKGAKIEDCDECYIRWIEDNLNNRPRKRLDYLTPNEYLLRKFNVMR